MLVRNKETNEVSNQIPLILCLNKGGEAKEWINHERAAFYEAKGKILWRLGTHEVTLRGGTNTLTGKQSTMTLDTIIAIDSDVSPTRHRKLSPTLTNQTLFERDCNICAYCGTACKTKELTRDHIFPLSKGGPDTWENVVSACKPCNQWKSDKTLEQADLTLLYVPYQPTHNEHLILQNRRILACQMDFLLKGVSKHSRIHERNN